MSVMFCGCGLTQAADTADKGSCSTGGTRQLSFRVCTHLTAPAPPAEALAALTAALSTTSLLPGAAQRNLVSGLPDPSREELASKLMSAALEGSHGAGTSCSTGNRVAVYGSRQQQPMTDGWRRRTADG